MTPGLPLALTSESGGFNIDGVVNDTDGGITPFEIPVVVATVGYRAANDAYAKHAKVRFEARDVITHIG